MNVQNNTEHKQPSLSIADIELETGIAKDTLRVWERRYGFPMPLRDAQGERRYSQDQLARLRLIKRLMDAGYRPGHVVTLSPEALQALPSCPVKPGRGTAARARRAAAPEPASQDFAPWLHWLATQDTERLRHELQARLQGQGLAHTVQHLIAPLTATVGDAWVRGELTVAHEHLYTETVQTLLRNALLQLQAPTHPPRILLTTLPKEHHHLGLLMAECFMALHGCTRLSLGPATPLSDIVQTAVSWQADVVGLSFSAHSKPQDVLQSLQQLRQQLPLHMGIWVGGSAPVLYGRRLPAGVQAFRQASELAPAIELWRQHHP